MGKPDKLIATDLDGTLFTANSQISDRNLRALTAATSRGFETVAVTGRSWRTATKPLSSAPGIDYIVCSNGAYLYRQSTRKVHWECLIPIELSDELVKRITRVLPTACFGWEAPVGFRFDDQFLALAESPGAPEYGGQGVELGSSPLYKLFVRDPVVSPADCLSLLSRELSGLVEISTSGAPFVELTASGVNKASGLARVCEELNIAASDVIAFGDNNNDLPMLRWAGLSVAMENAEHEVKTLTQHVTLPNVEDGVAAFLEPLLGNFLHIQHETDFGQQVVALLDQHLGSMHEQSPPDSVHALDLAQLQADNVMFWTIWDDSTLAGCGALKKHTESLAEIKSMRTTDAYLRQGVASFILRHILAMARNSGFTQVSLETGSLDSFSPARTLYSNFGFKFCEPFAEYQHDPHSVFMTLNIE